MGMPTMALPVLFSEIAGELELSLVQVGLIWGTGSLTAIFAGLLGGTAGDRFGTKRVLVAACLLTGIMGACRAFSVGFYTLLVTIFLLGFIQPAIPMNLHKACAVWFPNRQLGLANGFISTGMALGFLLGSLLSASVLSPALGGWRPVLMLYGLLAVAFGLFWSATRRVGQGTATASEGERRISLRAGLPHVVRLRSVWVIGVASMGVNACLQGMFGYLPLYLREIGWSPAVADSALATFHGVSLVATVPIALLSDRLRSRHTILVGASLMIAVGVGMLSVADGAMVWVAVILAGIVRDGYMAVFMTSVMEIEGVGAAYAGTAIGLVSVFSSVGRVVSPPLGNGLAGISLSLPFLFWAALGGVGFAAFWFLPSGTSPARYGHAR